MKVNSQKLASNLDIYKKHKRGETTVTMVFNPLMNQLLKQAAVTDHLLCTVHAIRMVKFNKETFTTSKWQEIDFAFSKVMRATS